MASDGNRNRMLRPVGSGSAGRGGGRRNGRALQDAWRPGARPDPEPGGDEPRAGVRVRALRAARLVAADGVAPSQEAGRRGPARTRAAWQVGLFLIAARGRREARDRRGPERSVLLMSTTADELREEVRRRYAASARAVSEGSDGCGCGSGSCCAGGASDAAKFGEALYDAEQRGQLPEAATLASLGCGNPPAVAELRAGEPVPDLGSGGGIDVILSAQRVGSNGVAYGVDMTDEMLALARQNAADAGVTNVHFLQGVIEQIPLPADSVDVVISNCVINLSTDKAAVLTEIARVLKPGGRVGVSDIVAEDQLTAEERAQRGSYVGCIAGALSSSEYIAGLEAAGFEEVDVRFTHEVADGMHGAIVKARKTQLPAAKGLPVIQP